MQSQADHSIVQGDGFNVLTVTRFPCVTERKDSNMVPCNTMIHELQHSYSWRLPARWFSMIKTQLLALIILSMTSLH